MEITLEAIISIVAQQDFIRNGDSFVTITANRPNASYQYTGIVQMWDPE